MSIAKPVISVLLLTAIAGVSQAQTVTSSAVIDTYANIAQAGYEDSLSTAKKLRDAVTQLTKAPPIPNPSSIGFGDDPRICRFVS